MTDRPTMIHALRNLLPVLAGLLGGFAFGMGAAPASPNDPASPTDDGSKPRRGPGIVLLAVAALSAASLLIAGLTFPRVSAGGWLIAFLTVSAIPLGSLGWLMIHRLTGGQWGESLRPAFESCTAVIPLLAVAFIPVLVMLPALYPWVAGSPEIKSDVTTLYLNIPLFVLRAGIGFIGWSVLALMLPRTSGRAGAVLAGVGLFFHAVIISLLSIDWILSAEPAFISTSFGATVAITQLLAALAFAALVVPPLDGQARRDLGGLLLATTLGVTYINFMAVLVIWYGDLPTKVVWFVERTREPWTALAVAAFIAGSVVPILLLLLARVRNSRVALRCVAVSSLAGLLFFDAWLLAPAYGPWALGATALALTALSCAFIALLRERWPAILFGRARTTP